MGKNVYMFVWEGKYLLDNEIKRWKNGFAMKFGADAIFSFTSENFESGKVLESIYAWWLFTNKKLVVIQWLPVDSDVQNKLQTSVVEKFVDDFLFRDCIVPEDVLLIYVSYKPDKRTKLYKSLSKVADVKEFKPLSGVQIKLFVKEQLGELRMEDKMIDYFLMKVGKNLYRIAGEIDKLKTRCSVYSLTEIDAKIVDQVVFGQVEVNSFLFFDYFLTDKKKSLEVWNKIKEEGTDFNQAIGMLYWWIKLYLFIIDLYKNGVTDSKTIAQTIKYHPFVVSKNVHNIKKLLAQENEIKDFYRGLMELDYKIKTGQVPSSYFWLGIVGNLRV